MNDKIIEMVFNVGYKIAKPQFRLERDLELRPLIEVTTKLIKIFKGPDFVNTTDLCHEIDEILKNLKPLNKDD